jgi:hypothetical protein
MPTIAQTLGTAALIGKAINLGVKRPFAAMYNRCADFLDLLLRSEAIRDNAI